VHIGGETQQVRAPAVAFVPPRTEHWVENALADRELHYLYISVWPDGIPPEEREGGWKNVYAKIIDSYVSRGYPVDAG
jgi:mannose-6-phosphate isomerase-like protein (cupin superfamily)